MVDIAKLNEEFALLEEFAKGEYIVPKFAGFYESIYDENGDEWCLFNDPDSVPEEILDYCLEIRECENWAEYKEIVAKTYLEYFDEAIKSILPNFSSEFVEIDSPSYYNFVTDRLVGKIDYDKNIGDIKKYIDEHKEDFKAWIYEHHRSRDGFSSYYPSDADSWDLDNLDYNELGSVIGFIYTNAGLGENDLNYETWSATSGELIWSFDLDKVKEKFNFDVAPECAEDLEYYIYDEASDTYKWNKEVEGQQKLDLGVAV